MKTAKLILLCLSGMLAMQSATAQSRSEKKAQTERNVREAINADHYKINVDVSKQEVDRFYPNGIEDYSQIVQDDHRRRWQRGDWTDGQSHP